MSQHLTNAINAHLNAQADLVAAVGGRIFDVQVTQDDPLPLVVYQRITNPVSRDFDGTQTQDATYQVDIYGEASAGGVALGEIEQLLYAALEGAEFPVTGHDRAVVTCINRDRRSKEDDALRSMSEYRVRSSST